MLTVPRHRVLVWLQVARGPRTQKGELETPAQSPAKAYSHESQQLEVSSEDRY